MVSSIRDQFDSNVTFVYCVRSSAATSSLFEAKLARDSGDLPHENGVSNPSNARQWPLEGPPPNTTTPLSPQANFRYQREGQRPSQKEPRPLVPYSQGRHSVFYLCASSFAAAAAIDPVADAGKWKFILRHRHLHLRRRRSCRLGRRPRLRTPPRLLPAHLWYRWGRGADLCSTVEKVLALITSKNLSLKNGGRPRPLPSRPKPQSHGRLLSTKKLSSVELNNATLKGSSALA